MVLGIREKHHQFVWSISLGRVWGGSVLGMEDNGVDWDVTNGLCVCVWECGCMMWFWFDGCFLWWGCGIWVDCCEWCVMVWDGVD